MAQVSGRLEAVIRMTAKLAGGFCGSGGEPVSAAGSGRKEPGSGQTDSGFRPLNSETQAEKDVVLEGTEESLPLRTLADIGCDHAYVSIALVEENCFARAIAADIHTGPLKIAAENIRSRGLSSKIETRLSDGFERIDPGEADMAVITGMGGRLITKILSDGKDAVSRLSGMVLGPQSEMEEFRSALTETDFAGQYFRIVEEMLIREDGKYYPVIGAVPTPERQKLSRAEKRFGPCLLKDRDPVLQELLQKEAAVQDGLLRMLSEKEDSGSVAAGRRLSELRADSGVLREAMRRMAE